jgi:hypothetical protein
VEIYLHAPHASSRDAETQWYYRLIWLYVLYVIGRLLMAAKYLEDDGHAHLKALSRCSRWGTEEKLENHRTEVT